MSAGDENGSKDSPDVKVVVGLSVRNGHAYFAVVECPVKFRSNDPLDRVMPSDQVDRPERLADFHDRVAQELRRIRPCAVGVGFTRKYNNWSAEQAFSRFSLDAAAMLAATDLGIPCQQVREEDAARAVGVTPTKLAEQAAARIGITETPYWKDRVWAIATAVKVAKEQV